MSKDVVITVGAEDTATKVLRQVEQSTNSLTASVDRLGKHSETSGKVVSMSFAGMAKMTAGVGAAIAALKGLTAGIDKVVSSGEAYRIQEEAARGATEAQKELAAQFQRATNAGDEATLQIMKQAELLGVSKDASGEAAIAATALSKALGINTTDALKKVNQAMNGNANAFAEFLPEMRRVDDALKQGSKGFGDFISSQQGLKAGDVLLDGTIRSVNELSDAQLRQVAEQQKLQIINEAVARGMGELKTQADSTGGIMERAAGAFGDLSEIVGKLVDPIQAVIFKGLAVFGETMQGQLLPTIDRLVGGLASLQPVIDVIIKAFGQFAVVVGVYIEALVGNWLHLVSSVGGGAQNAAGFAKGLEFAFKTMAESVIKAITFVEVGWQNLDKVVGVAVNLVLLKIEQFRADIEHIFTTAIPAYFKWFGENGFNLLQDYFNLYVTVLTNFGEKISNFFSTIFQFISSGFEGGASGLASQLGEALAGSLIEGFEAKTQPLPEVVGRSLTQREQDLQTKVGSLANSLADEYNTKIARRIKDLDINVNGVIDFETPDVSQLTQDLAAKVETTTKVQVQPLQAQEQRLLTRGQGEDPNMKIAENTKQSVQVLKEVSKVLGVNNGLLAQLAGKQSVEFVEVA